MKTQDKPRTAKARVGLAADGVTLVDPASEESVSLFASENETVHPKKLSGKKNVEKYFGSPEESDVNQRTAKSDVYLEKDGETLIGESGKNSEPVSLFAREGQVVDAKLLEGKKNVSKFFGVKETAEPKKAVVETHTAAEGSKRVVAEAAPAKTRKPRVKK